MRRRAKPGPKARIRNPYPTGEHAEWLGPLDLDHAERDVRAVWLKRRDALVVRDGETVPQAVTRIARLAPDVLDESPAVWWSALQRVTLVDDRDTVPPPGVVRSGPGVDRAGYWKWWRRHVGPTPPRRPVHGCLWLDTSGRPHVIRQWDKNTKAWSDIGTVEGFDTIAGSALLYSLARRNPEVTIRWRRLPLVEQSITRMLTRNMGRAGRSGKPAFLAYATLAALLDETPERIADLLANYRRKRAS